MLRKQLFRLLPDSREVRGYLRPRDDCTFSFSSSVVRKPAAPGPRLCLGSDWTKAHEGAFPGIPSPLRDWELPCRGAGGRAGQEVELETRLLLSLPSSFNHHTWVPCLFFQPWQTPLCLYLKGLLPGWGFGNVRLALVSSSQKALQSQQEACWL